MEEQYPPDPQFSEATQENDHVKTLYERTEKIVKKYGRVLYSYPDHGSATVWVETDSVLLTIGDKEEAFTLKTTGGEWQQGKYNSDHLPEHFEAISAIKLNRYSCGGSSTFVKINSSGKLTTPLEGNNSPEEIEMTSSLLDKIEESLSIMQIPRVRTSKA